MAGILDAGPLFLGGDLPDRSVAITSKSRIMDSSEATFRAFSAASNRLAFNAASRGFITRYPKHLATLHLRRCFGVHAFVS